MNITFSYNWLKEYVDYRGKPAELARLLSLSGVSVEKIDNLAKRWDKIIVAKIEKISRHPNADKLSLVDLDAGKEKRRLVCGGTNLREGMLVALALPGAFVFDHDGREFELKEAVIRGEKSPGMICAAAEIGLALLWPPKNRDIVDLTWTGAKSGITLAAALTQNDVLFEVEITTNRPDALAIIGLAREAAAVTKSSLKENHLKKVAKLEQQLSRPSKKDSLPLEIIVRNPDQCPRFQVITLDNIAIAPSPWWLKWRLAAAGIRPINNLVDITNYVMLEYGQPLHVFDYDTLKGKKIEVRLARRGESYLALNGKTYTFTPEMLIGLDAERAMDLVGIMGGELSGVSDKTTRIVLQAVNVNPVSVRKTSRALGLRSDAVELFEKGLAPEGTGPALTRAVELVQELAGGRVRGSFIDVWRGPKTKVKPIILDPKKTDEVVGVEIPLATQVGILQRLGFVIKKSKRVLQATSYKLHVLVPYWRARDVEHDHDLVEEIARVYGYSNVPSVIPQSGLTGRAPSFELQLERRIKEYFKGAGFTEVYPYSLVPEKILKQFGLLETPVLRVTNPLSEEYACLRPSLLPSLAQIVSENQEEFAGSSIFEIAKQYHPLEGNSFEDKHLAAGVWGEGNIEIFYTLKGALETLFKTLHAEITFVAGSRIFYHPGRQADIMVGKEVVGHLGELHPQIAERFSLARRLVLADISFASLVRQARLIPEYTPPPVFPPVKRDLALVVEEKVTYAELVNTLKKADLLLKSAELFDVYRGKNVEAGKKSLAFHLLFWHDERTLTAEEVEQVIGRITATLRQKFGVVVRD